MKFQQAKQSKPVAVTSLAFPTGDVNNFVVGSEDGAVYTACRYFKYNQLYIMSLVMAINIYGNWI